MLKELTFTKKKTHKSWLYLYFLCKVTWNVKFGGQGPTNIKGQLRRKMNLWSNYTLVRSQPFSEICFHDYRM